MRRQTAISGSLALDKSPRVITIPASGPDRTRKLRVAAYARVSSDSEDQLHSFAAQNAYFTELITSNPEWEFVDVYADEGITGTSTEKRDDFQRLLKDCRRGRIDKVLTKSTARFARNTSESLMAVRELRDLGIGVCFEEQGIDTAQMSGELLTAIFSMMAQKESESISENIRWTYQKKMKKGSFITCKAPFGYRLVGGGLEIVEAEAEIIRLIFRRYLNGRSMEDIAKEITRYGIPTRDKTPYWQTTSIQYVLHNEKYAGDSLSQKTYTTRALPHRKKRNLGEYDQYFVPDSHPAIVDREVFDRAQTLLKQKGAMIRPKSGITYPWTGTIICGTCGSVFKRKKCRKSAYWTCRLHDKAPDKCQITQIPESEFERAFLRLYYKLRHHGMPVLSQLLTDLQTAQNGKLLWSLDIVELNKQIADITRQERLLAELKQQDLVDPDVYITRNNTLAEQLRTAKLEKERFLESEEDQTIRQTQVLLEVLETGPEFLEALDEELFSELVEKVIVESNECLRFRLINGLELTEPIERTVR
ncbi:MAG: recombinase family protein [Eubacteriales bacterium]|nr:recombinase family protein [Eubacteriales bacterium]